MLLACTPRAEGLDGAATVAVLMAFGLPLLTIYIGDGVGWAVIAATTIRGAMVMGMVLIFLAPFLPSAGPASFYMALWPGLLFGVLIAVEAATGVQIFPAWIDIGSGKYADDLGINVYRLLICISGYLIGALLFGRRSTPTTGV